MSRNRNNRNEVPSIEDEVITNDGSISTVHSNTPMDLAEAITDTVIPTTEPEPSETEKVAVIVARMIAKSLVPLFVHIMNTPMERERQFYILGDVASAALLGDNRAVGNIRNAVQVSGLEHDLRATAERCRNISGQLIGKHRASSLDAMLSE